MASAARIHLSETEKGVVLLLTNRDAWRLSSLLETTNDVAAADLNDIQSNTLNVILGLLMSALRTS